MHCKLCDVSWPGEKNTASYLGYVVQAVSRQPGAGTRRWKTQGASCRGGTDPPFVKNVVS
eukprot:1762445-Pyramimonas_sp.AAC.1